MKGMKRTNTEPQGGRRLRVVCLLCECGEPVIASSPVSSLRPTEINSKHVLNAQVSIRAPCCQQWFDCPECHAEKEKHELRRTTDMTFVCKKCKKTFRKDMTVYEESDEYCPHCDNHYVIEAKTPQAMLGVEGEDARMDNRILRDDRMQQRQRELLMDELAAEKLI